MCVYSKPVVFLITHSTHLAEVFFKIHYVHFRPVGTTDKLGRDLVVQPESYGIERVLDIKAKKEFANK